MVLLLHVQYCQVRCQLITVAFEPLDDDARGADGTRGGRQHCAIRLTMNITAAITESMLVVVGMTMVILVSP